MDTEFHFYITGMIARAAGFKKEEAKTIAWASEFTDENDEVVRVQNSQTEEIYENYISQTMNILKPKQKLMRIYPVFHFLPGEPDCIDARRRDGKMHLLNTTPDNELARDLLNDALKAHDDTRLYRIGIAIHAYADTWAHQNFVGWYDIFNNIALDPKPDIGHADAEHHPDWIAHRWDDGRLVHGEINNIHRFMEAAEHIYTRLRKHLASKKVKANKTWDELKSQLAEAMKVTYSGSRQQNEEARLAIYKSAVSWLGLFDKDKWQREAMEGSLFELISDGCWYRFREDKDFQTTDWYRFQEAIKEHQARAMMHLDPLFMQMGVNLHEH